ncbi:WhiB family transcriptional regulator [Streptomyces sp. NPDC059785]|uniref:WhiB family transcriptional regulator n=1 Tax=Streptomyces sp. NPDC059785 TaxID=3346945 RepID=UPI003662E231
MNLPATTEEGPTAMHAPAHHRADTDPWVERAACREADPDTFFPPAGGTGDDREATAKRLCAGCPVSEPCLREALRNGEITGIWGGLNVRERREVLRIASTLSAMTSDLAAFLANGGRRIDAPPRLRPAYVWFLHRRGWSPGRIARALGLSFGQVQQALRTAEFASAHVRIRPPEHGASRGRRKHRTREDGALAGESGRTS